jgi:hypothetical protein
VVYFGRFFAKLGFSLHIINYVGKISEAAMIGLGDIILYKLAQWKGTPSYCDFFAVFFYIIRRKDQRSCDGRGGGRGIRELYYIFADFFQN